MQPFSHIRARSVQQVVDELARGRPGDVRLLAGGTNLVDLMRLGVETPTRLVDITGIPGLSTISVSETGLTLGALVRMSDAADHPDIRRDWPAVSEALWKGASAQLRNMATLGGNLMQRTRCPWFRDVAAACDRRVPGSGCAATGGPDRHAALLGGATQCVAVHPGDFAVALTAFDARVEVIGPAGNRHVPVAELLRLPGDSPARETSLDPAEMILGITIPSARAARHSAYVKLRDRASYAFALASAAAAVVVEGGIVTEARIALGGVATIPWRAPDAEASLIGRPLTPETAAAAGRIALQNARPGRQNRFRIDLAAAAVAEALITAGTRS